MKIQVNGKDMAVDAGATVASLLEGLGFSDKRVAVEHNRVILARDGYGAPLNEGDIIEIISFVGGG
jgi:thiamine biosynthesis protein ThiS